MKLSYSLNSDFKCSSMSTPIYVVTNLIVKFNWGQFDNEIDIIKNIRENGED